MCEDGFGMWEILISNLVFMHIINYSNQAFKRMKATAYYFEPEGTGDYAVYGLTYTGKKAGYGLVVVDP